MGALGDVIDRWNEFPTPVKILVIGGVGVAGYLGYQHFVAGGAGTASGSSSSIPLDLAPQGTTDNLSANGGANSGTGTTSTGGTTSSGGTGTTSTGSSGSGGGTKPVTGGGPTKSGGSTTTKKPKSSKPVQHPATVKHLQATARTKVHPDIGYSTKAKPRPSGAASGSGKRPTLQ